MAAPVRLALCSKAHIRVSLNRRKHNVLQLRFYCARKVKKQEGKDSVSVSPFKQTVNARRNQASRSLLASLSGTTSEDKLIQYCNSYGKVVHYFTYSQEIDKRYALVEFKSQESVNRILSHASAKDNVKSRFLSFSGFRRTSGGAKGNLEQVNKDCTLAELVEGVTVAESVPDQLDILTRLQELRDSETRLRFLVCSLIEDAFQTILPDCSLHLFGSSVNGFGCRSCDMDMYLERNTKPGFIPVNKGNGAYSLQYDGPSAKSERAATQAILFALASYLKKEVPHCILVVKILHARCPLVKFRHYATGLSCDLTADNSISLKSSELLYLYSQLDPRVRPLVFMVRHWARHYGITSNQSGYWLTNFPLTLLVVFFLQTRPQPVVPSLDYLQSLAGESDSYQVNGVDCVLPSDLSKVVASKNVQSTAKLLEEFYSFCATFQFDRYSLSVRRGQSLPKPDNSTPLYMENPFETQLNMCRNVSSNLLRNLQNHAQHALRTMESPAYRKTPSEGNRPWGIGRLLGPLAKGNRSPIKIGNVLQGLSRNKNTSLTGGKSKIELPVVHVKSGTMDASQNEPK